MSGWEPLASSDPVPGDPERIKAVARRLADIANAVGQQSARLRGVSAERIWTGDAARRFEADKDDLPPLLDLVRTRYSEAGSVLERYAPVLAEAQAKARRALAQARTAQADIADAERGVDRMEEYARDERTRVRTAADAFPERPAPRPIPWSGPNYHYLLGDAQADLASARDLLDEAIAQNETAGHAAARAIYDAIDDDIRNTPRSRAQAAAQWVTENFPVAELSKILGVIAAVAGVLALLIPAAAPVLGTIALVAGGAKLLLDLVLLAASDFDRNLAIQVAVEAVLLAVGFGIGRVAAQATSLAAVATPAALASPTTRNVVALARILRFAERARFVDRVWSIRGAGNDALAAARPDSDFRGTWDIYRSHPLLWTLTGPVGAAMLYHHEHRPPRPGSTIAPISPLAPASR